MVHHDVRFTMLLKDNLSQVLYVARSKYRLAVLLDLQISLVDMLYRKSLRITAASKGRMGVGAIVNLQSNDASKLWGMAQYLHILWSGPFQVITWCASLAFCP